jgi:hypothetical protein
MIHYQSHEVCPFYREIASLTLSERGKPVEGAGAVFALCNQRFSEQLTAHSSSFNRSAA